MQQKYPKIKNHIRLGLMTSAWIAGLVIAGSDNLFMPWLNLLGLGLFTGASLVMGRILHAGNQKKIQPVNPASNRTDHPGRLFRHCPENQTVGYALGVFIKT